MIGDVLIYDAHGELIRKEFWVDTYCSEVHNGVFRMGEDGPTWIRATDYRQGTIVRETERKVLYVERKGWRHVTRTVQYDNQGKLLKTKERHQTYW